MIIFCSIILFDEILNYSRGSFMKKKVLSIMLSIIILFGSSYCWLYSYAKNSLMNYNKNLLESILSDRYWLIETLVDGNLMLKRYC